MRGYILLPNKVPRLRDVIPCHFLELLQQDAHGHNPEVRAATVNESLAVLNGLLRSQLPAETSDFCLPFVSLSNRRRDLCAEFLAVLLSK